MKNFRTIATSLLLFQHCLFPVTIFAEEAPVEIDTELVQRLQEQNELPTIESNPPTTESTAEEPVHTEPAEVPTTEDSNPEQPEQPETVETTEPPIPETSEETVETTTPSAEDGKESSEGNGLPSPVLPKEEETEQLMVLPEAMRMSTYSLPNLNEYRHHLVDNGRSAYIEGKMQRVTNRELTLGEGAGAVQRFTVTFDAYTMVQAPGNGWISWIASNLSTAPDFYFQQMYYGNHPSFSNPYTLNNLRGSGVPSYLSVTATPTISGRQVTIDVLIIRMKTTTVDTNEKDTIRLLGNLTMGTTAVAPQVNNYSKKIADVNYPDAVIGEIIVKNPKPSAAIKDSVDVEATRNALSQDTIKSWFTTLPSNSNDYTFSATGPASWAPGATGTATVVMKHNSNGSTQTFTTRYTVRDTQKPTAKFKNAEIEARRTGGWTREDLLKFIDGNLQDNWSLPENIRIEATDNDGIYPLAGRSPRDTWAYVDIYDEAGNKYGEYVEFKIVDKQAPKVTAKTDVEVEARRSGELSQAELRQFVTNMSDNWTLPENLKIHLFGASSGNPVSIAGRAPFSSNVHGRIRLEDEAGNKSLVMSVLIRIVDTQRPTGTMKDNIEVEARRSGDLSQAELRKMYTTMNDNWTLPEDMKVQLSFYDGITTVAGIAPGKTVTGVFRLKDEAGNQSFPIGSLIRIVDTQAPTATIKTKGVEIEARRTGEWTREDLLKFIDGDLQDNWSLPEDIRIEATDNHGIIQLAGRGSGDNWAYIDIYDEAGNKYSRYAEFKIVDTQAPTGTLNTVIPTFEYRTQGDWSREELLTFFSGELSDNWSEHKNITATMDRSIVDFSPSVSLQQATLTLTDEAGNKRSYPFQFFLTSFVIEPNVLIQAQRMPALSKETIKSWFQGLPSMVDEHYDFSTPESTNGWEPGKAGQANVTIRNKVTNATQQTTTNYTVVDTQSPEGRVKTARVTMEADRSRNFTQEELRQFFEELSDNWSYLEDITLKSSGSLSSLGPNTANNHYILAITATDEEKNSKRFERALVRINDTKAPTGTVKNEHMDIEARRTGDLSQDELRQFFTSVNDNWTLSKDIRFHLVNADGSATSIAGMNPGTSLDAYIQLEDEAGNKSSPMKISANIVDTTGPQGKLKENLAFQKGSAEPNARDYLDGEPSDNWTAPEAIKVTVAYENNADFTDLTVGTHKFVLTLADEYGNTTDLSGELEIQMNLKGYIDVTIPARISFAESKESGGIVSPKYQIQNNSNEELTVSVASMTSQSQTEKLTDIDLLMSNNYNDATIPLIENGQNLSQKTELVTLPKKTSSFAFSLYGTVGQNFDFDSLTDPLKPQYALQFNFAIN
ncbi:hypothetical protein [Enterococcus durans]|uniref:hypothetical protein n=1 Tax=Enterococcus durans TaxID=53345 RepID=UPI001EE7BF2F|nr:hypothetical protein [Enterococcus durans]